jgi:hypothetical protein
MKRLLIMSAVCLAAVALTVATYAQTKKAPKLVNVRETLPKIEGALIPLPLNMDKPYVVTHIPVTDCRAVRGFVGSPIDGTPDSRDYNGRATEYNRGDAGDGVGYYYRKNDGLHITLADRNGVNAIQVRGGIRADVVTDCAKYDDPSSGAKLMSFDVSNTRYSAALFEKAVASNRFSFFNVKDGFIADVCFFRVGGDAAALGEAVKSPISGKADSMLVGGFLEARFEREPSPAYAAFAGNAADGTELVLKDSVTRHIIAGPFESDTAISAVGLEGALEGAAPASLIMQVQDPIHPRTAVTTAALAVGGSGKLNLAVDIPDQVIPKGKVLWLTLRSAENLTLKTPTLVLYKISREQATPGALAYHLTKLKGFYIPMSEGRPWNALRRDTDIDQWLVSLDDRNYSCRVPVSEIRNGADYCYWLNPDDSIARQYHDWFYRRKNRPQLPPARIADDPGAPEWAVAARAAWLAARSVPEWWLANRVVPTGELGRLDDDTDQYQNYAVFPLFESDGVAAQLKDYAARLLLQAEASGHLEQGINRHTTDLLHAYEEGLNQEAMVAWWHYGDPLYMERCMIAARSTESLTFVNAAGHRHFIDGFVGARDLKVPRKPGEDSGFSGQMMHPLCEVVYYNKNPRAIKVLSEYGAAWAEHMDKAEAGKYPSGIKVETDEVTATDAEPYSGGFGCHMSAMAFLAKATGDEKYLRALLDFWAKGEWPDSTGYYLADIHHLGFMDKKPEAFAKLYEHHPAFRWFATGEKKPLIEALKKDVAEIQTFGHMYTTAEVFTDRVFLYAAINPALAYTGGFATRNKPYHSHAVSWEGFGTDYAALVRTGRRDAFHALVFNFRNEPMRGAMRFWMLDHGLYEMSVGIDENGDDQIDTVAYRKQVEVIRGNPVALDLPARKVTVITLKQKAKLDPIEERADLALSPKEIVVKDGAVEGVLHNIGTKDVMNAVAALVDAKGEVVSKVSFLKVEAPWDLEPRRMNFRLEGLPSEHAGWRVVLDPYDTVPEITELNNSVLVP